MDASTWWWVLAGALVVVELLTGTFYLLALALGGAAGALAATAGLDQASQITWGALVGGGAAAAWHVWRVRQPARDGRVAQNTLDAGQLVQVTQWREDGSTQVHYRGALWSARLNPASASSPSLPSAGTHRIVAIDGSQLLIEKV
jgi:membrane protein implicated in regulation of membrane protease activity